MAIVMQHGVVERIDAAKILVGLYATPERIVQIRQNRLLGLKAHRDDDHLVKIRASQINGCAPPA